MIKLSDFVKIFFRKSGLISLIGFQIFSTLVFFGLFYNVKQKHLYSTLSVSSQIINKSFEVGDWDLILSHLNSINLFSKINNLVLVLPSNHVLAGPIGIEKNGIWNICKRNNGELFSLEGCTPLLANSEIPIFVVFQFFILMGYLLVFSLVIRKIKDLTKMLSLSFEKLTNLNDFKKIFSENPIMDVQEIVTLKNRMMELFKKEKDSSELFLKQNLMRQLSHDIRSPLAALNMVKETTVGVLPKEQAKLLEMSINRITDIANTILPKGKSEEVVSSDNCFIWMLVDQIVSEKRVQYKRLSNINIDFKTDGGVFAMNAICNQTEFMRALSNMIDNSVEARVEDKTLSIAVSLHEISDKIRISVQDNGKGIPQDFIDRVFEEGFTSGKKHGSGLGLYQVKKSVEQWGGQIYIESTINVGTKVSINLKKSERPEWLVDSVNLHEHECIYVLDDEEYVYQLIKDKFDVYGKDVQYFKQIPDFVASLDRIKNKKSLFFIDYDLKQDLKGLEVISKCNIADDAILLTGNYDDKQVQQLAIKQGVKILPKPLIHEISIVS
jgi:signal transduction histidine kinase